jgi:hypothetical protein
MSLAGKQQEFMRCIGLLLVYAYEELPQQYEDVERVGFTAGDFWADDGHHPESTHYARLGADLNLFVDGVYIDRYTKAPQVWDDLGAYWESLHKDARWGGRFGDYNHFSFEHEGVW